jgi:metal-responsive CopG/Arc/MetJ family transcriptional regulator
MKAEKILISLPHDLAVRMRTYIAPRQRSKLIAGIIKEEVEKREQALYQSACMAEKDQTLNDNMKEFNITLNDGMTDEAW